MNWTLSAQNTFTYNYYLHERGINFELVAYTRGTDLFIKVGIEDDGDIKSLWRRVFLNFFIVDVSTEDVLETLKNEMLLGRNTEPSCESLALYDAMKVLYPEGHRRCSLLADIELVMSRHSTHNLELGYAGLVEGFFPLEDHSEEVTDLLITMGKRLASLDRDSLLDKAYTKEVEEVEEDLCDAIPEYDLDLLPEDRDMTDY